MCGCRTRVEEGKRLPRLLGASRGRCGSGFANLLVPVTGILLTQAGRDRHNLVAKLLDILDGPRSHQTDGAHIRIVLVNAKGRTNKKAG